MNWSHHIDMIYKKASCRSYQILKCLRSKNIWTLIKLFTTYVRPILESNTSVWSPFYLKDISHIESVQRSYTRTAFRRCGIAFSSYGDRLKKINLKSLEERRLVFDLLLVYKIIYGLCDLNFTDFFIFNNSNYNLRRHSLQIKCTKDNLSQKWQNSYFCRVVKIWNSLSENVVRSINIFSFKRKLFNTNLSQFLKLSLWFESSRTILCKCLSWFIPLCTLWCFAPIIVFAISNLYSWWTMLFFHQRCLLRVLKSVCSCFPVKDVNS